jgi:hypothetical protein
MNEEYVLPKNKAVVKLLKEIKREGKITKKTVEKELEKAEEIDKNFSKKIKIIPEKKIPKKSEKDFENFPEKKIPKKSEKDFENFPEKKIPKKSDIKQEKEIMLSKIDNLKKNNEKMLKNYNNCYDAAIEQNSMEIRELYNKLSKLTGDEIYDYNAMEQYLLDLKI